jgi:hypothetical protein
VLIKPFHAVELIEKVRYWLERSTQGEA